MDFIMPCLASKEFTRLSGMVRDMSNFTDSFVVLQVYAIPLTLADNRHILVPMCEFPEDGFPHEADDWIENDLDFTTSPDLEEAASRVRVNPQVTAGDRPDQETGNDEERLRDADEMSYHSYEEDDQERLELDLLQTSPLHVVARPSPVPQEMAQGHGESVSGGAEHDQRACPDDQAVCDPVPLYTGIGGMQRG
jgi:hypothetical protein